MPSKKNAKGKRKPPAKKEATPGQPRQPPLSGRVAYGLAALSGLIYFLGFPGVDFWPLSFVALVPLILALRGQTARRCAGLGWVAGMIISLFGFYWLREMLIIFSKTPEPIPTLLMVLICVYQAGRLALCGFVYGRAVSRGWSATLVFAGAFAVSELIYPLLFPWYFGASVHNALPMLQIGDVVGPIGIGLVLVAPNLAMAHVIAWRLGWTKTLSKSTLAIGLLVPALAAAYGFVRIAQIEALQKESEAIKVALVQGTKPLGRRGDSHQVQRRLTAAAKDKGVDLVIWSESVYQAKITEEGYREQVRARITRGLGVPTIVGTLIAVRNPPGHPRQRSKRNSALLADGQGRVTSRYDKHRLLMFGEYLPLGEAFPGLYKLSPNSSAFSSGTSLEPLRFGDKRLATTICYEAILPAFFNDMVRHAKPDLLVNLTNDAWFGDTIEPWQHFALAKLRTIEHRRYLARATNTGVSAIVDATGAVVTHGSTFTREVVTGEARFLSGGTVYQVLGDKPWWLLALVMLGLCIVRRPQS